MDETVQVAVHLDEGDAARMRMALNNIANLCAHYAQAGQAVAVELVANGPGLALLRADLSPLPEKVAGLAADGVRFSACANTLRGITRDEGAAPALLPAAQIVPSGVVRLIELQRAGWAYLRP